MDKGTQPEQSQPDQSTRLSTHVCCLQAPSWTKDASAPPAPGNTASAAVNRRRKATTIAQVRGPQPAGDLCVCVCSYLSALGVHAVPPATCWRVAPLSCPPNHFQPLAQTAAATLCCRTWASPCARALMCALLCVYVMCWCRRTMPCISAWLPSGPARTSAGTLWRQGTGRTRSTGTTAHSSSPHTARLQRQLRPTETQAQQTQVAQAGPPASCCTMTSCAVVDADVAVTVQRCWLVTGAMCFWVSSCSPAVWRRTVWWWCVSGRVCFYWGVCSNASLWPCLQLCVWRQAECCNQHACACGLVLRYLCVRLSSHQHQHFAQQHTTSSIWCLNCKPPRALSCPSFTAMRLHPVAANPAQARNVNCQQTNAYAASAVCKGCQAASPSGCKCLSEELCGLNVPAAICCCSSPTSTTTADALCETGTHCGAWVCANTR